MSNVRKAQPEIEALLSELSPEIQERIETLRCLHDEIAEHLIAANRLRKIARLIPSIAPYRMDMLTDYEIIDELLVPEVSVQISRDLNNGNP